MSVVSLEVVAKLRDELRSVIDRTLALAASARFRRVSGDAGNVVATLAPTPQQSLDAAGLNERLQRWSGIVTSLLRRYALAPAVNVEHEVRKATTYLLLQRSTPSKIIEGRWRRAFDEDLTKIRLRLEQVLDLCEKTIPQSTPSAAYEPIDITIDLLDERNCRVTLRSAAGEVTAVAPVCVAEADVRLMVEAYRRPGNASAAEQMPTLERYGRQLFSFVGDGVLANAYTTACRAADSRGARRWIRLHLAKAGFLAPAPWEVLNDGSGFLAVDASTVISRSALRTRQAPPGATGPLRVLVTLSSPCDCLALGGRCETQLLEDALGGLQLIGRAAVDVAPDGTLDTLRRMLRNAEDAGRPYDAWHFIGHGGFNAKSGESELAMVGRDGKAQWIGARELRVLFDRHPLRFAILNACESGTGDVDTPAASVAGALVDRGTAAVVAMQFMISDDAAIVIADEMYGAFATGIDVLGAMTDVRRAIYCLPRGAEWLTPVLILASEWSPNTS
jgi:hypothetical protein